MKLFYLFFGTFFILSCATLEKYPPCSPALFPYSEYSYLPEVVKLNPSQMEKRSKTIIETKDIRIPLFEGWSHKEVAPIGHKFTKGTKGFYLSYGKHDPPISFNREEINDINISGCSHFSDIEPISKTMHEFYQDLYSMTPETLKQEKGFWPYWILYNKTQYFKNVSELKVYKGNKLVAFQRTSQVDCKEKPLFEIFFEATKANKAYSMGANFKDDDFFNRFFEALNALN